MGNFRQITAAREPKFVRRIRFKETRVNLPVELTAPSLSTEEELYYPQYLPVGAVGTFLLSSPTVVSAPEYSADVHQITTTLLSTSETLYAAEVQASDSGDQVAVPQITTSESLSQPTYQADEAQVTVSQLSTASSTSAPIYNKSSRITTQESVTPPEYIANTHDVVLTQISTPGTLSEPVYSTGVELTLLTTAESVSAPSYNVEPTSIQPAQLATPESLSAPSVTESTVLSKLSTSTAVSAPNYQADDSQVTVTQLSTASTLGDHSYTAAANQLTVPQLTETDTLNAPVVTAGVSADDYVYIAAGASVYRFDLNAGADEVTNKTTIYTHTGTTPYSISVTVDTINEKLYVLCHDYADFDPANFVGAVKSMNLDGTSVTDVTPSTLAVLDEYQQIRVDEDGGKLYMINDPGGGPEILETNLTGGAESTVITADVLEGLAITPGASELTVSKSHASITANTGPHTINFAGTEIDDIGDSNRSSSFGFQFITNGTDWYVDMGSNITRYDRTDPAGDQTANSNMAAGDIEGMSWLGENENNRVYFSDNGKLYWLAEDFLSTDSPTLVDYNSGSNMTSAATDMIIVRIPI